MLTTTSKERPDSTVPTASATAATAAVHRHVLRAEHGLERVVDAPQLLVLLQHVRHSHLERLDELLLADATRVSRAPVDC
jgi:hypothetical protein